MKTELKLVIEIFKRLAATLCTEDATVTAKMLWEKVTAVMTDSVNKNLQIEWLQLCPVITYHTTSSANPTKY